MIEKGILNSQNNDLFKEYYFTDFVISLNNYEIYGSLFLKLKSTAIQVANTYNYILFESSNYFNHPVVFKNFENYTDPHSDYFGALANYGIFGFTLLLAIPIYMVVYYFRNIKNIKLHKDSLIYFLIILMILIEAIIVDILHVQFAWVIFAMYFFSTSIKKDYKINQKN